MARRETVPGWTRVGQNEFKAAITAAAMTEPDLCQRLRRSIQITASRRGVQRELRDQYICWISEVEAAISAMAEAQAPNNAISENVRASGTTR